MWKRKLFQSPKGNTSLPVASGCTALPFTHTHLHLFHLGPTRPPVNVNVTSQTPDVSTLWHSFIVYYLCALCRVQKKQVKQVQNLMLFVLSDFDFNAG